MEFLTLGERIYFPPRKKIDLLKLGKIDLDCVKHLPIILKPLGKSRCVCFSELVVNKLVNKKKRKYNKPNKQRFKYLRLFLFNIFKRVPYHF